MVSRWQLITGILMLLVGSGWLAATKYPASRFGRAWFGRAWAARMQSRDRQTMARRGGLMAIVYFALGAGALLRAVIPALPSQRTAIDDILNVISFALLGLALLALFRWFTIRR